MTPSVIFIQKRTHRAGAQTCLARLLDQPVMRPWNPLVVSEGAGWLTRDLDARGLPHLEIPFPSSRSLEARLWKNRAWAKEVARLLQEMAIKPLLIQGNDYLEGLLTLELAARCGAPRAIMLRSVGMTARDYGKYRCREFELVSAVGDEFLARVKSWDPGREVRLIRDGLGSEELSEPPPRSLRFPEKILVLGSPLPGKGWADAVTAFHLMESDASIPDLEFHFTGDFPSREENDLGIDRLQRMRCKFLGRVEAFRELVQGDGLVINPSRQEAFGMAAVETLAAGVPLLSSRAGVMEQIQLDDAFLFHPGEPGELAVRLSGLAHSWSTRSVNLESCQDRIRRDFMIGRSAEKLDREYRNLIR